MFSRSMLHEVKDRQPIPWLDVEPPYNVAKKGAPTFDSSLLMMFRAACDADFYFHPHLLSNVPVFCVFDPKIGTTGCWIGSLRPYEKG